MTFTSSQKNFIKSEYEKSKTQKGARYHLVYKENNEYKSTWSLVFGSTSNMWDWEHYEYRLLKFMDRPIVKSEVEDIFVYVYNGMVYYNDPNNELHVSYLNGIDEDKAFNTVMTTEEDFRVLGENMIVGSSSTYDPVLRIVGDTDTNSFERETYLVGPKIALQTSENRKDGWLAIVYSDKQDSKDVNIAKQPYLKLNSKDLNEYFIVPRKRVVNLITKNHTARQDTITNANITNLSASIIFRDIQQICKNFFPIGCFYWTSDNKFIPSEHFGGTWERVVNTFMYAAESADSRVTSANYGEAKHTLTSLEMPVHNHALYDYGHVHGIENGIHSHAVRDYGHHHLIRTVGDDYNGYYWAWWWWYWYDSKMSGNFVGDGHSDMSWSNSNRGIYAINSKTNISLMGSYSNVSLYWNYTGCSCLPFDTGGKPHENMPPYIPAFCWHRIA